MRLADFFKVIPWPVVRLAALCALATTGNAPDGIFQRPHLDAEAAAPSAKEMAK